MSQIVYRLEDDNGWGCMNEDNRLHNYVNEIPEAEIHNRLSFYSMLPEQTKQSLTKEELLLHHCSFTDESELASLRAGSGYNVLELEISSSLPKRVNDTIVMFKKEHIISSKIIRRT